MEVNSEQAYVIAVTDEKWAAPYRSDIVVRTGKPVPDVNFVLVPATRVHGRVTVGKDNRPVSKTSIGVVIDKGSIPAEIKRAGDRYYRAIQMYFWTTTDADGRFAFHLGPGDYQIRGPARTESVKFTIPTAQAQSPVEIVRDFHMPRAETGPLIGRVVDLDGRPVAGAVVNGTYASSEAQRWFQEVTTDKQGQFSVERSLDPLVLHARTADGKLAGVTRSDAEDKEARVTLEPVATASGILLDPEGKPLAQKELRYGIRVHMGPPRNSPFMDCFGGTVKTGPDGRYTLNGLVRGEAYSVNLQLDESRSKTVTTVKPEKSGTIELAEMRVDPNPMRPYVPPTPAKAHGDAFAAKAKSVPARRIEDLLVEAKREYTRPMVLLGRPNDPACIDLYRLFNEEPEPASDKNTKTGGKPSLPNARGVALGV